MVLRTSGKWNSRRFPGFPGAFSTKFQVIFPRQPKIWVSLVHFSQVIKYPEIRSKHLAGNHSPNMGNVTQISWKEPLPQPLHYKHYCPNLTKQLKSIFHNSEINAKTLILLPLRKFQFIHYNSYTIRFQIQFSIWWYNSLVGRRFFWN